MRHGLLSWLQAQLATVHEIFSTLSCVYTRSLRSLLLLLVAYGFVVDTIANRYMRATFPTNKPYAQ